MTTHDAGRFLALQDRLDVLRSTERYPGQVNSEVLGWLMSANPGEAERCLAHLESNRGKR